ncbi:MAG: phage tail tape measure protein [Bradyrhizobiaceae bacterium]|nr:phage tail tape measure protein [Bradyrhizobiaceae bacterium]
MTELDGITIAIDADTRAFRREIAQADTLAQGFGRTISRAFEGAIVRGRDFGDVLRGLAMRLSSMAIGAAFKPLEQGFAGLLQNLFQAGLGGTGAAPSITPFAAGGVIATPTYFPLGPSLGVAGERGAEAILPLARGADGRLGVRAESDARPFSVTVNISTPDAASFRRSEAYVSGAIARAVARGERSL